VTAEEDHGGRRARPGAWVGLVLVLAALVGFSAWRRMRAAPAPDPDGATGILAASPGELIDVPAVERSGRALRTPELRGTWNAVSFVFTSCAGTCPPLTAQLKQLQDARLDGLRLVTFTVQPDVDTAEVLGEYASRLGADAERWLFLRTTADDVQAVARGLKVNNDPVNPIYHSNDVVLLDPQGRVVALYHPLDDPAWRDTLAADLGVLRRGP
jgi:cytochrome oxidase Cu insertion factor (SCO1/SenC/PrrC family)